MGIPNSTLSVAADAIADTITHVSLHSGDPGTTGANEISGGSYARAADDGTGWTEVDGVASNDGQVSFPTPTAPWGTVPYFGVWAGTVFRGGAALSQAKMVALGADLTFATGALRVVVRQRPAS